MLRSSERAPGLLLGEGVELPDSVEVGGHVVVHAGTVVGSRRMATFDDMELERKLTIYDKGFDEDYSSYGEYIARSGDVSSPRIPNDEPLRIEASHFIECVREGREPRSNGESGLRVVRVLERLQRSLMESSSVAGR